MNKTNLFPATRPIRLLLAFVLVGMVLGLDPILSQGPSAQSYDVCPSGCTYQSVQAAINASTPGRVVRIGPGTYVENLELRAGVSLQGAGTQATVLKGLGNDSTVKARGSAIQRNTRLQALTITGGNATPHGGGISVTAGAALTVLDVIVRDNAAAGLGGGVFVTDDSAIDLTNVRLLRNRGDEGAALTLRNNARATVQDSQVTDNVSLGPSGAINVLNTSSIAMQDTVIRRNSAVVGAGMRLRFGSTAQVTGGHFSENVATSRGGAISTAGDSTLALTGVAFSGNTAPYAGAVHIYGSEVTIAGCTMEGNRSNQAGGAVQAVAGASVTVSTSRFTANESRDNAGAIYLENSSGSILNSIFEHNHARSAGGAVEVFDGGDITIADSAFHANEAFDGGALYVTDAQAEVNRSSFVANVAELSGGAVAVIYGSDLTLRHSTLEGNITHGYGGALTIQSQSTGLIQGNLFRANQATGSAPYPGVGIAGAIKVFTNATPVIMENRIEGNLAMDGAGVYVEAEAAPVLVANDIVANIASRHGGGVVISTGSTPELFYNLIGSNRAGSGGGGIFITSNAAAVLTKNTISGNQSGSTGGGLAITGDSNSHLIGNQISYNRTNQYGGGLHLVDSNVTLAGNEIRHNRAGLLGGGVMVQSNSDVEIAANLIEHNLSNAEGDGFYITNSAVAFVNNTVARNAGDGIYLAPGSRSSLVNNLVAYNDHGIRSDGGQVTASSRNAVTGNRLADYAGISPGPNDIAGDPALITGPLGEFYLQQRSAGQSQTSPLVDAGEGTAASWGLDRTTTRTDSQPDRGAVDVGYHYQISQSPHFLPLIAIN